MAKALSQGKQKSAAAGVAEAIAGGGKNVSFVLACLVQVAATPAAISQTIMRCCSVTIIESGFCVFFVPGTMRELLMSLPAIAGNK